MTTNRPLINIPDDKLPNLVGRIVHVKGWRWGTQFRYMGERNGKHFLRTPTGKQDYFTTDILQYQRADEPDRQNSKLEWRRSHEQREEQRQIPLSQTPAQLGGLRQD